MVGAIPAKQHGIGGLEMKKKPYGKTAGLSSSDLKDTSTTAQRQRLIEALREAPLTTLEIRKELDILAPAPRIFELRRDGHEIATQWLTVETYPKARHRIARYVLIAEKPRRAA